MLLRCVGGGSLSWGVTWVGGVTTNLYLATGLCDTTGFFNDLCLTTDLMVNTDLCLTY